MTNREYDERLEKLFAYDDIFIPSNSSTARAYGYSNEDMERLFKMLDVKGKSVLTVGSSGDQVLNAVYYGAKDVTLLDANIYTLPVIELKMAGIKNLEYDEFIRFWRVEEGNESIIDSNIYAKISHDLSDESKMFWDTIMLEKGNVGDNEHLLSNLFSFSSFKCRKNGKGESFPVFAYGSEFYRDVDRYNVLKSRLATCPISYKEADILDAHMVLTQKYDVMLLSNIYDYMTGYVKDYCKAINVLERDFLNDGGKIQLHYDLFHNGFSAYADFWQYLNNKNIKTKTMFSLVASDKTDGSVVEDYYTSGLGLVQYLRDKNKDRERSEYVAFTTSTILLEKEREV